MQIAERNQAETSLHKKQSFALGSSEVAHAKGNCEAESNDHRRGQEALRANLFAWSDVYFWPFLLPRRVRIVEKRV